jgi:DNA-directed RNA polymerase specialized sigma24 family protein
MPGDRFTTTRWSVVLKAASPDEGESRDALSTLCQAYWTPVFSYIRGQGHDAESARDLTQGFFAALLARRGLAAAKQERGRFRSFVLGSVKNFLSDEWDRDRAQKRGGGQAPISIDSETWEGLRAAQEPATPLNPETIFARQWALALIERAQQDLASEMDRTGGGERFRHLAPYLVADSDPPYRDLGQELGMTENAVRVSLHRLRQRFGVKLREHVAETVDDPDKTEDELRYLINAMSA